MRLKQTLQQKDYNEDGELIEDVEVNSVLYGTLIDVDDKFVYLGDDAGVQLVINIDTVSVMTNNADVIAEWLGNNNDDGELPTTKENLN